MIINKFIEDLKNWGFSKNYKTIKLIKTKMTDRRKNKFYLDNPIIVLNGLVTDKNNYSYNDKIEFLKNKKRLKEKKINNKEKALQGKKSTKKIEKNKPKKNNEKVITLSEDSDSNNDDHRFNSEIKTSKRKINKNNKKQRPNSSSIFSDEEISDNIIGNNHKKRKIKENKISNNKKIQKHENISHNNMINDDIYSDSHNDSNDLLLSKNKKIISDEQEINIKYKKVEESIEYNDIKKKCKEKSCVYVPLFEFSELKLIIERNSRVFELFKKLKKERKEEKDNIIISEEKQEENLINSLNNILKKNDKKMKQELFKKLHPEFNNILKYLPNDYCGINKFGFMNINSYSYSIQSQNKMHFITSFFKDKTNQNILKFRKYILNLSSFISNNQNNNNDTNDIYHIIIPKENSKNIDINFNEEMDLNTLLGKINCEYYFYNQKPGELLIVEPGCIHLTYYMNRNYKQERNYLLMFWNKMSIDSFSDYNCLQNDCIKEEYKNLPILSMLFNLVNKKLKYISGDNLKTILEIYNKMDSFENINKYINEINKNNISFHKFFLKGVNICNKCHQELFNYYVYFKGNEEDSSESEKNENNNFICINCAYKKNFFSNPESIIFYKYQKASLNLFKNKITENINTDKIKITIDNYKDEEVISECFNLNKRKDDVLNVDEFILKIDGPLNVIDKDYENNKNFFLPKNIKVDKYLKYIGNDKSFNGTNLDPLDKNNFRNNINENDIYEELNTKEILLNNTQDKNDNIISNIIKNNIVIDNKNSSKNNNIITINDNDNIFMEINNINNKIEEKKINEIKNGSVNKQSKKKKKKVENISDLIANGDF
jgi:hypothetical protein